MCEFNGVPYGNGSYLWDDIDIKVSTHLLPRIVEDGRLPYTHAITVGESIMDITLDSAVYNWTYYHWANRTTTVPGVYHINFWAILAYPLGFAVFWLFKVEFSRNDNKITNGILNELVGEFRQRHIAKTLVVLAIAFSASFTFLAMTNVVGHLGVRYELQGRPPKFVSHNSLYWIRGDVETRYELQYEEKNLTHIDILKCPRHLNYPCWHQQPLHMDCMRGEVLFGQEPSAHLWSPCVYNGKDEDYVGEYGLCAKANIFHPKFNIAEEYIFFPDKYYQVTFEAYKDVIYRERNEYYSFFCEERKSLCSFIGEYMGLCTIPVAPNRTELFYTPYVPIKELHQYHNQFTPSFGLSFTMEALHFTYVSLNNFYDQLPGAVEWLIAKFIAFHESLKCDSIEALLLRAYQRIRELEARVSKLNAQVVDLTALLVMKDDRIALLEAENKELRRLLRESMAK